MQPLIIGTATLLSLFKFRNRPKILKIAYGAIVLEILLIVIYVLIGTYFAFKNDSFAKLFLTQESGYYSAIVLRLSENTATYLLMSLIALFGVKALAKRRPLFLENDGYLMGMGVLSAVSGFYQFASFQRLSFVPFVLQSVFLVILLFFIAMVLSAVISWARGIKGRYDVVPVFVISSVIFGLVSSRVAGYLAAL